MSDGPHRSLKMPPSWKKVAEFADMAASGPEDVAAHRDAALQDDWKTNVPELLMRGLCEVLGGDSDSLFADQKVEQLRALRRFAQGHEFGLLVIDCAIRRAISGNQSGDAAIEAVANAVAVWCARRARQIEEHYQRKSSEAHGRNIRTRIERGVCPDSHTRLARQLLGLDGAKVVRRAPKRTGLDDGVPL